MKQFLWFILAGLFLSSSAQAQETPAWEISGGYSYLVGHLIHPRFHLNGVNASLDGNLNDWFGLRFDFNAYSGPASGINNSTANPSAQTFALGPVFSLRRYRSFTPFVHLAIGGAHGNQIGSHGYIMPGQSSTVFATSAGGGVDFRINKWAGIRLQGNYMTTTFHLPSGKIGDNSPCNVYWNCSISSSSNQGNLQISGGIVIGIGKR
jgi:Outer membrane protein beta-barrel domain